MTVIVGMRDEKLSRVVIGADRLASDTSNFKMARLDHKAFIRDDVAIGFTWSYRYGQIVRYHAEWSEPELGCDLFAWMVTEFVPSIRKAISEHGYMKVSDGLEASGEMLVGVDQRLFVVSSDFSVAEPACGYAAIGSGAKFAMGAVSALAAVKPSVYGIVEHAVSIAAEHDTTVAGFPLIVTTVRVSIPETAR